MCGFLVFVSTDGTVATEELAAALDLLRHRGPDETSLHVDSGAAFGFQRLAIVDVAHSHQPVSWGGWTVVFNGELYNFRQLRAELIRDHGADFSTEGEAEVLAAAFHHWGPTAVHRLRGMFAAVLRDRATGVVHAIRDPFGIKPLYHLQTADGLYLASEKKALLPFAGASTRVDTVALSHYLTLQYVPEPATLHPSVRRLEAGHTLTWTPGTPPAIEAYFRHSLRPAVRPAQDAIARCATRCATASTPTCSPRCRSARSCPVASTRPPWWRWPGRSVRGSARTPSASTTSATARSRRRRRPRRRSASS